MFDPVRGVCPFGSVILWDRTMTLCLYGRGVVFVISYIRFERKLLILYKYEILSI